MWKRCEDLEGALAYYRELLAGLVKQCRVAGAGIGELALQGAAVHVQGARRRRNVAVIFREYLLQVFPFQAAYR